MLSRKIKSIKNFVNKKILFYYKSKNRIKNIIIFLYDIALESFRPKNPILYIGPSSRRRYLKYYINCNNIRFIPCPSPFFLFFLPLLHLRSEREIFISDVFFFNKFKYKKIGILLNSIKCKWIIWNDKLELYSIPEGIRNSVQTLSFFSETECEIIKPKIISRDLLKYLPAPKRSVVSFAGQANHRIYKEELRSYEYLLEYIYENYLYLNPVKIFKFSENPGLNMPELLRIKFRHQCINLWRKLVIEKMSQDFQDRMLLVGQDFLSPEFGSAIRFAKMSEADALKMYSASKVCLDLGSQCGLQPLYPRSLEILFANPASLVQTELDKSINLFSNSIFSHSGGSYEEIITCVDKLLSISATEYLEEGSIIYENIKSILRENIAISKG